MGIKCKHCWARCLTSLLPTVTSRWTESSNRELVGKMEQVWHAGCLSHRPINSLKSLTRTWRLMPGRQLLVVLCDSGTCFLYLRFCFQSLSSDSYWPSSSCIFCTSWSISNLPFSLCHNTPYATNAYTACSRISAVVIPKNLKVVAYKVVCLMHPIFHKLVSLTCTLHAVLPNVAHNAQRWQIRFSQTESILQWNVQVQYYLENIQNCSARVLLHLLRLSKTVPWSGHVEQMDDADWIKSCAITEGSI